MLKASFLNILFFSSFILFAARPALKAQTKTDFENFGHAVFELITDTGSTAPVEYIRLRTHRELIERQPISWQEKGQERQSLERNYAQNYDQYQRETQILQERFRMERFSGGEAEFLSFTYQEVPNRVDMYLGELRFLYRYQGSQSMVTFRFQMFYNGRGLGLMSPIEANY
jgi:DNA repair ATPase RecN